VRRSAERGLRRRGGGGGAAHLACSSAMRARWTRVSGPPTPKLYACALAGSMPSCSRGMSSAVGEATGGGQARSWARGRALTRRAAPAAHALAGTAATAQNMFGSLLDAWCGRAPLLIRANISARLRARRRRRRPTYRAAQPLHVRGLHDASLDHVRAHKVVEGAQAIGVAAGRALQLGRATQGPLGRARLRLLHDSRGRAVHRPQGLIRGVVRRQVWGFVSAGRAAAACPGTAPGG
jgi:hypothetical protein